MGLLDPILGTSFDDPRTQGAMALAQGLLSDPRPMRGLASGVSNYGQILAQDKQQKQRAEAQALQMQMQRMALEQALAQQQQAGVDKQALMKLFTPTAPINANAASGIAGPRPEALQSVGQMPQFNPINLLLQGASLDAVKQAQALSTLGRPKFSTAPQYDQQGRAFVLAEDGSMKYLDGVRARDKLTEVRLGDKVGFRTEYSPETVGSLPIGQSPDSVASGNITMRGQNMTDARARELAAITAAQGGKPQFHDGQWISPPSMQNPQGTAIPVAGYTKPPGEAQKKQLSGIESLNGAIGEYVNELGGWHKGKMLMPDARASMGTKYNNMMLQAKEAYNLGVLNGPDYQILTSVVADPTAPSSALKSTEALTKQAKELRRIMGITAKAVRGGGAGAEASSGGASGGWSIEKVD